MSNESSKILDVNQADLEELRKLPYVNRSLAEKIVAGRPYQTLQDLRRVNGIGKATVQRLQPFLLVSTPSVESLSPSENLGDSSLPAAVTPLPESKQEPADSSTPSEAKTESPAEETIPEAAFPFPQLPPAGVLPAFPENKSPGTPTPQSTSIPSDEPSPIKDSRSGPDAFSADSNKLILWGSAAALLILFLSLLFNLGVMAVINGGVRYATAGRAANLEQRLSILSQDTAGLQQEISSLRARLDSLEALSGRMDTVEQESAALRTQTEQLSSRLEGLDKQLEEANNQLSQLDQRVSVFDRFLEGLRSLLAETLPLQPQGDKP